MNAEDQRGAQFWQGGPLGERIAAYKALDGSISDAARAAYWMLDDVLAALGAAEARVAALARERDAMRSILENASGSPPPGHSTADLVRWLVAAEARVRELEAVLAGEEGESDGQ